VNVTEVLLFVPPEVTLIAPVLVPLGIVAVICVPVQVEVVIGTLLIWSVPDEPNPEPAIVTELPTGPAWGETELTKTLLTVNVGLAELATPPAVTVTVPVIAFAGTVAVITVSDHTMLVGVTLPIVTVLLVSCVAPKPDPLIWIELPAAPPMGTIPLMTGLGKLKTTS
jgi:hypothetical protein